MTNYILSILGIVLAGVLIDVVMPSGKINKYIKSIYSIFIVVVLLNPLLNFLNKHHDFTINYKDYEVNVELVAYIYKKQVIEIENKIKTQFEDEGFNKIDIKLNYSIENNELQLNSCTINLKNLVIVQDKQHINKYEFIKEVIKKNTALNDGEIIINE